MEIKRITPDLPRSVFEVLAALDRSCFANENWSAQDFLSESEKHGGIVLAAYIDNDLAGLIAGFTASDTGEILTVAVSPEHRRMGIARRLLEEFLTLLPDETETIALEVRQSNSAAIALYESFGFTKTGVRRRFYRGPAEDADIMVKNI